MSTASNLTLCEVRQLAAGSVPGSRLSVNFRLSRLTSPTQSRPSCGPGVGEAEAASLGVLSSACEPTWAEIIVISGWPAMISSTMPTTRSVSSRAVPTGMRDLEHDHILVLGGHEFRAQEGDEGQGGDEAGRGADEDATAVVEGPVEPSADREPGPWRMPLADRLARCALRLFFERKRRDASMGTTVRATKSEATSEKAMDRASPRVSLGRDALGEDHGQEDDDRRQRRGRDGHADLGGARSWPPSWRPRPPGRGGTCSR